MNTDTVTVGCKIPNGMILHTITDDKQRHEIQLNGNRLPRDKDTGREIARFEVVGTGPDAGYGLTFGVPRDLWERIEAESRDTPPFKNNLVFSVTGRDRASAHDLATDLDECKSGLEPLDQSRLPKDVEKAESR